MVSLQFALKGGKKVLLSGDDLDYVIYQGSDHVKRTGEKVVHWHPHQYCRSLRTALILVLEMKLRAADAETLKELQSNLAEARNEMTTTARRIEKRQAMLAAVELPQASREVAGGEDLSGKSAGVLT